MLIPIEAVFTETLRASMSEIVKIDIDKPIAFVHFTLRAADDIDGAPGCIPKAIYAVQDRFLQLLQVPAMEFDSVCPSSSLSNVPRPFSAINSGFCHRSQNTFRLCRRPIASTVQL